MLYVLPYTPCLNATQLKADTDDTHSKSAEHSHLNGGTFCENSLCALGLLCCCPLRQDVVIQTEDEIRVKIVGTRVDATDIVSNITINYI